MHTVSLGRPVTDAIAINAAPQTVRAFLADARNLPAWAPAFAEAVRPDGDTWLVSSGGSELRIVVPTSEEHGTVDFVAAADGRLGLFTRVLPNGDGCACVMTIVFGPGTPQEAVDAQMTTIASELETIRSMVETDVD